MVWRVYSVRTIASTAASKPRASGYGAGEDSRLLPRTQEDRNFDDFDSHSLLRAHCAIWIAQQPRSAGLVAEAHCRPLPVGESMDPMAARPTTLRIVPKRHSTLGSPGGFPRHAPTEPTVRVCTQSAPPGPSRIRCRSSEDVASKVLPPRGALESSIIPGYPHRSRQYSRA